MAALRSDLNFANLDGIEDYSRTHSRAARYVASIRSLAGTASTDKGALMQLCNDTGVAVTENNNQIEVPAGS